MKTGRGRSQGGAVIVTVCLMLLFLLGFMAFALDFGRLFVVKSELQTAMDSCALAAAQELDGTAGAIARATSAGLTAGNSNRVDLQSPTWRDKGQLVAADLSFRAADYTVTTSDTAARYAQCQHVQNAVQLWLLQAMGAFTDDAATFPGTQDVSASAVATRASAQSSCPLPLAMKPKTGSAAPNYGFSAGEWVTLLMGPGGGTNGQIGWANLDGSNSASETEAEVAGHCGTKVGDHLGTPGVQASIADVWNYRFGIYRNSGNPATHNPDFTGYIYTTTNWKSGSNAYKGAPAAGSHPTAQNFIIKRQAFASCDDQGTTLKGANSCESISGLNFNGGFSTVAAPGASATGGHAQYGATRRIATVPVVNGSNGVIDFVCMLMLQPISIPMPASIQLEYIGNAAAVGSPCTTNGLPGGSAGPLVPVLVR
jgi:hypothetical protein